MKKLLARVSLALVLICIGLAPAWATSFVSPVGNVGAGHLELGVGFVGAEIETEIEDTYDTEAETDLFGGSLSFGLTNNMDLYGFLGYDSSDEGFLFGVGIRHYLAQIQRFRFYGHGQFHYFTFDEDDDDLKWSEITIGATAVTDLSQVVSLFAGIEAVPFSDGDANGVDFERDGLINFRGGAIFNFTPSVNLRGDICLGSETTFGAVLGFRF